MLPTLYAETYGLLGRYCAAQTVPICRIEESQIAIVSNLKTADALKLNVPLTLLPRANEVVA